MDRTSRGSDSESGAALDGSAQSGALVRAERAVTAPRSEGSAGRAVAPDDCDDDLLRALAATGC